MSAIHDRQCGLCTHFGENHNQNQNDKLVAIRTSHQAPEDMVDACGHPKNATLHLMVTPISGCDGFAAAA